MKALKHIIGAAALVAVVTVISGCASSEQPNYQGQKGTAPTVYDYYPSKTNTNQNR